MLPKYRQIVAWLLAEDMLGGFHFNDRRYADDDLTLGSIDPYRSSAFFMRSCSSNGKSRRADIAYMIDQSHNLKGKIEAMIQTVGMAQDLFAKAALVDHEQLIAAQKACDLVRAESLLQDAFCNRRSPRCPRVARVQRTSSKSAGSIPPKRLSRSHLTRTRCPQHGERRFLCLTSCLPQLNYCTSKISGTTRQERGLADSPLGQLRYRSNLLGADLRITNFGGGNTSAKIDLPDPFTGKPVRVLAVKGSGGDLGSINEHGFALLYLDRLEQLKHIYRGEEHEDQMVRYYPLSAYGENRVAASIDTPLHAFLPFPHVDHLHPDWSIALAASANGKQKLEEFNKQFGRKIVWLPWQRPGFELALLLEKAVQDNPGCDGVLLGSHGLFTWGNTNRECYLSSIRTIDQMGEFILERRKKSGPLFGGIVHKPLDRPTLRRGFHSAGSAGHRLFKPARHRALCR